MKHLCSFPSEMPNAPHPRVLTSLVLWNGLDACGIFSAAVPLLAAVLAYRGALRGQKNHRLGQKNHRHRQRASVAVRVAETNEHGLSLGLYLTPPGLHV